MTSIDRVLMDPDDEALFAAVRSAIAAVDLDMEGEGRTLGCDPEEAGAALAWRMRQQGEGVCEWRIPGPGPNGVRAALIAVWWSDYFERRHLRLLGGCRHRGMDLPLPIPSAHRPALACVYPESCVVATEHRRPRLLAVCECGAWGEPNELAWMGPACGPCWDRSESDPARRRTTLHVGAEVSSLAFAPDGRLAVGTADGRVGLWDLDESSGPRQLWLDRPHAPQGAWSVAPGKLAFSSDGGYLGCLSGNQQRLALRDLGWPTGSFCPVRGAITAFAFAAEPGRFFAEFLSGSSGHLVTEVARCEPRLWDESWSPWPGEFLYEVAAGEALRLPFPLRCHDLAVSPDGRVVAAACRSQGLCFWDAHTGEPIHRAAERHCQGPLLWSPDGTVLACGVDDTHWKAILYDFCERERRAVVGDVDPLVGLAFTPDARWLFSCERNSISAWEVATGTERFAVAPAIDQACAMAISPDGGTVALAVRGGRVRLWPTGLLLPED